MDLPQQEKGSVIRRCFAGCCLALLLVGCQAMVKGAAVVATAAVTAPAGPAISAASTATVYAGLELYFQDEEIKDLNERERQLLEMAIAKSKDLAIEEVSKSTGVIDNIQDKINWLINVLFWGCIAGGAVWIATRVLGVRSIKKLKAEIDERFNGS